MTRIKKSYSNKCWWELKKTWTLIHCFLEWKLVQMFWKTVWQCLRILNIELPWRKWKLKLLSYVRLRILNIELPWRSESENCSVMSDSLWPHGLYSPSNSPGQNTGVGSLSLLQQIFLTQGSNPSLPHCRWILYQLSHQGSPELPYDPEIPLLGIIYTQEKWKYMSAKNL